MKEEQILEWVLELYESDADVIESVDRKTLQVLINDVEHLAVFFCKNKYYINFHNFMVFTQFLVFKMMTNVKAVLKFFRNWKILMMIPISMEFSLTSLDLTN